MTQFDILVIVLGALWAIPWLFASPQINTSRLNKAVFGFSYSFIVSMLLVFLRDANASEIDLRWVPAHWPVTLIASALAFGLLFGIGTRDQKQKEEK